LPRLAELVHGHVEQTLDERARSARLAEPSDGDAVLGREPDERLLVGGVDAHDGARRRLAEQGYVGGESAGERTRQAMATAARRLQEREHEPAVAAGGPRRHARAAG